MKENNIYLEKIMNIKNYMKRLNQSHKQKENWAKYRFNYQAGINSYQRLNPVTKELGFLGTLLKANKKKLNESIYFDLEYSQLNNIFKDLVILQSSAYLSDTKELSLYEHADYSLFVDTLDTCITEVKQSLQESYSVSCKNLDLILWLDQNSLKTYTNTPLNENLDDTDLVGLFMNII